MKRPILITLATLCLAPPAFGAPVERLCDMTYGWKTLTIQGTSLRARTLGSGPPLMMLPSLGRGPDDFNALAKAVKGRTVILFEPRWFSTSDGPQDIDLFAIADDAALVLDQLCPGQAADVIGHAFGNRVARTLAASYPEKVRRLLLFASGGQTPIPPDVGAAILGSTEQGEKHDAARLADISLAFFAKGHDPKVWLYGWSARAARLQQAALRRTAASDWQTAGTAEILVVQADEDPVAPISNALALQARAPDRVKIVILRHASHAMLPEQPKALAALTNAFLAGETDQTRLQAILDKAVVVPIDAR